MNYGDWKAKRAKPPCGFIASSRGCLVVEIWNRNHIAGRIVPCTQPVGSTIQDKFFVVFLNVIFHCVYV
jgi:hypothetical protein